jgi:hypothetical protein
MCQKVLKIFLILMQLIYPFKHLTFKAYGFGS